MPWDPAAALTRLRQKLTKAARLLAHPRYRRALRLGVAAAIEHEEALAGLETKVVVDVGANKGQFSLVARHRWPGASIHAFEPIEAAARRYEAIFEGDERARLYRTAVGEVSRTAVLHLSKRQDSSSLLPVGELQRQVFPGTEETGTTTVPLARLCDVLTQEQLGGAALLKIDVQGYELEVLKGADELLEAFRYVYVECSGLELYEGQALAHEVIEYLGARRFRLVETYNPIGSAGSSCVQADYLFERTAAAER